MTTIYNYDGETGQFTGEGEARPDPLVPGEFLIPRLATTVEPPAAGENETAVWVKDSGWRLAPDFRGTVYWTADKVRHEIRDLWETPPEDAIFAQPPGANYAWNGSQWVLVPPTAAELDADADRAVQFVLQESPETAALAMVLRDVVQQSFGISKNAATQEVRNRFRDYYRSLIDR